MKEIQFDYIHSIPKLGIYGIVTAFNSHTRKMSPLQYREA
jgi:hypothetical protein